MWISVNERLPEYNQEVLTYWPERVMVQVQTFYESYGGSLGPWWMFGWQNHSLSSGHITHWMPLPAPPSLPSVEGCSVAIDSQPVPLQEPVGVDIGELVISDLRERIEYGRGKYGVSLHAHDGRDTLADAYMEALDLSLYLRKAIVERDVERGYDRVDLSDGLQ